MTEIGHDHHLRSDGRLAGADMLLDEASVMATENAIMAASLAKGTTVIHNAASEPHVQDLCQMLVSMGASIRGSGRTCSSSTASTR
jgi:UDP-N-acetylglucosamine 1-carboxyvinyltransferase